MWKHRRSLLILLFPVLLLCWIITGGLIYGIVPGIDFVPALVIAATIVPTDPVIASSIIGNGKFAAENIPEHLRNLLTGELRFEFVLLDQKLILISRRLQLRRHRMEE